jgi:hypothetical protein
MLGLFEAAGGSENSMPQRKPIRTKNIDVPRAAIESGAMSVMDGRDLFPGAQPPDQDPVRRYAVDIAQAWQKAFNSILEVSKVCADADDKLDILQRMRLIARLPFGRTMFCKLSAIGRAAALHNPDVAGSLPPNWTILDLARKLTPAELDDAISKRVLRPNSSRAELQRWMSNPENCQYAAAKRGNRDTAAINSAVLEDKVLSLIEAWKASPALVDLWRWSPDAVRTRFTRIILKT